MNKIFITILAVTLSGCATMLPKPEVRQQDIDAWINVPVEALDTHSIFLTIPMIRTMTASGIEIRNYRNGINVSSCSSSGDASISDSWVKSEAFSNCSSNWHGCNNIFYIKENLVIDYAPTGNCFTDERAQPQARYKRLSQ